MIPGHFCKMSQLLEQFHEKVIINIREKRVKYNIGFLYILLWDNRIRSNHIF